MVFGLFRKEQRHRVAVFIDGPNMIRKEFSIDLSDFRKRIDKYGKISVGKVFLNQYAPEKLIEAVANEGFETVIALADPEQKTDVDVPLTVHAMVALEDPKIDVFVLASRDADFLPLLQKARERGKTVVLIAAAPGLATSLKNAADHVEILEKGK